MDSTDPNESMAQDFSQDSAQENLIPDVVEFTEVVDGVVQEVVIETPFYYIEPAQGFERLKLDTRAELGLRLFASGYKMSDAAKIAKTRPQKIRQLLQTDQGQQTMKNIRLELDEEFKALYRDAIQTLRIGLASQDLKTRMEAADKYLKYAKDLRVNLVLTAEDLIRKIKEGSEDLA